MAAWARRTAGRAGATRMDRHSERRGGIACATRYVPRRERQARRGRRLTDQAGVGPRGGEAGAPRSFVQAGARLRRTTVASQRASAGLAASALATVAVAALSSRGPGDFALASRPKVAKAARLQPVKVKAQKAEAPPAVESDAPAKKLSYNPDDLWLDQQIDKFIAFLAGLFGRR